MGAMRWIGAAAFLAAFYGTGQAQQPQNQTCPAAVNYENADIRAVIDEFALRTGRTFLLDPRVQGQVTVKSPPNGGLCVDEAWELFQAVLRVHGYVATPISGNTYKIVAVQEGPRQAGPVGAGEGGDLVTQIVRLRYVDAREAAANLAQIVSERGVVAPVRSGNAVIIVDTSSNVERLKEVLGQIDRDTTVYRTIALNNASATEVARVLSGLARQMSQEQGEQASQVSIVPVEASNSILIRAEPSMLTRLSSVVDELDQMGGAKADLSVIYLNHADAEELAPLLREVANAQEPQAAGAGGGENQPATLGRQRAQISFHKPTNSIIINGDADIQRTLRTVIEQLDVRRAQVLIEAIIVEVSDRTAKELGVQFFFGGTEGSAIPFTSTNFRRSGGPDVLSLAGPTLVETGHLPGSFDSFKDDLAEAALDSLLALNGIGIGGAGQIGDQTVFGALLNALKQDDTSNVLSTPSVVTLDNQKASLSVGQEIPITTGEAVGDDFQSAFRTVSREQVGTILEVTPQINEGGTITLEIRQETSSVAGPILSTSTDLITNKREISTTALVDNGEILVIGGLVDEMRSTREDKVPLLGDIPLAGNLFKSQSRSRERRNLMVFIRPTILRDRESAGLATRKKLDYLRGQDLVREGGPTTPLDRLIEQVTGTATPDALTEDNE
jgi:general secretion pathway protein D